MTQEALRKLSIGRSKLILDHGFFGMLALRLNLVAREDIPTLAVDGKNIFFNSKFVMGLEPDLVKSALAHEVMHCVFDHMMRRKHRNPKKWNFAGDYAINQILKDSGFVIGDSWLLDPQYAGKTADEIYSLLPDMPEGEALCEIMPGDADSMEADAMDWKIATMQAASVAEKQGKLPDTLKRFVDDLPKPKVDWRRQLARFFTQNEKDDYSWLHPNKKFLSQGIYLPGLWSENMGPVAVAIDTSGSISNEILQKFGAEIKALVAGARPSEIHVIYCDAAVNHVDVYGPDDKMEFKPHGGGGTDFNPPFKYLAEKGIRPECFVYLTDLFGPFPPEPGYPTLWVATTPGKAPIGETIHIEV